MKRIIGIIFLLTLFSNSNAQDNSWRGLAGFGLPEYFHLGLGYQFHSKNLGSLTIGTTETNSSEHLSITLEHTYFLKSSRKFAQLKTWYFGQKVNYLKRPRGEFVFLGIDIGKQFNISQKIGISFDAGIAYYLYSSDNYDPGIEFLNSTPTFNLQLFYRI